MGCGGVSSTSATPTDRAGGFQANGGSPCEGCTLLDKLQTEEEADRKDRNQAQAGEGLNVTLPNVMLSVRLCRASSNISGAFVDCSVPD